MAFRLILLRHLWSWSPGWAISLGLGTVVSALLPVAFTVALGQVVGAVPPAIVAGMRAGEGDRLTITLGATIGIYLAQGIWRPVFDALRQAAGAGVNHRIREEVAAIVGRPTTVEHLEDARTAGQVTLAQRAVFGATAGQAIEHQPIQVAKWLDGLVSAAVLGVVSSWWTAVILLTVSLAARWPFRRLFVNTLAAAAGQVEELRRAAYARDLVGEPNPAAKEIRLFGLLEWLIGRMRSNWLATMAVAWRHRREGMVAVGAALAAIACLQLAVAVHLAWWGATGVTSLVALSIGLQSAWRVATAFDYDYGDYLVEHGLSTIPQLQALATLGAAPQLAPAGRLDLAGRPQEAIRFEAVHFTYPGTSRAVLSGVSLSIKAGQSLAIVGANGAGKSTLIKLLAGLYRPTAGTITVDGIPLTELDVARWRRSIAIVFQDFARFPASARDNIAFGRVEHRDDIAAIRRAAVGARATDVLDRLPWGLETILSKEFRQGTELSGGEWQRIALARAFFAVEHGARLVVLDEPTAHLDARAEADVFAALLARTAGLTTILISHRFATVRRAERICVLDQGGVLEDGSHHDLLSRGGVYARMFTLQASRVLAEAVGERPADAPGR